MPVLDPPQPERRLRSGYYLENFEALLGEVERRYGDLLRQPEWAFLADFRRLGQDARRLYVRLLTRRGPWFRLDTLRYQEIDVDAAAEELVTAGFATEAAPTELEERLGTLRRAELLALIERHPSSDGRSEARRAKRRADLLAAARPLASLPAAQAELAASVRLVRLLRGAALRGFRLLYFGNLRQDWTEFVLRDLGVLRFEPYRLDAAERTFADRAVLDQHLELRWRRDEVEREIAATPAHTLESLARALGIAEEVAATPWHASARRRADGILLTVARELEKRGGSAPALALYAAAQAPPARERRVRLLAQRGGLAAAAALCREIAAAPRDESERVFAMTFGARLEARRSGVRRPSPRGAAVPARELLAGGPAGPAEEAALRALERQGYLGFFAENWLWRALFGLAFWDVLFAAVPGAFAHPFQYGPLDLYDGFRAARQELVEARLAELAMTDGLAHLLDLWDSKRGTANRLVPWNAELRPHLEVALGALRGRELAAVCDRLSRDLARYGSGFPDLFLTHPERERLLLAEVKAPGDVLRAEQRGWLQHFAEHDMPAVVLHLRWQTP